MHLGTIYILCIILYCQKLATYVVTHISSTSGANVYVLVYLVSYLYLLKYVKNQLFKLTFLFFFLMKHE